MSTTQTPSRQLGELFRAEMVGTAVLVLVGLSVVILMFGEGGPIPGSGERGLAPVDHGLPVRHTGAMIAVSPLGKRSGAHINPIVTLAFRLMESSTSRHLKYVAAQLSGGILGCLPLLAWGAMGRSVSFCATPREQTTASAPCSWGR